MIVGSMAGALCAAGGFCAGSDEIVEHQRLSAASYTYSAALPAMSAVTASETLALLQSPGTTVAGTEGVAFGGGMGMIQALRENIRVMWSCLEPRSEWVKCTSSEVNPMMMVVLKDEVVRSRRWSRVDVEYVLQEVVDEVGKLPLPILHFPSLFSWPTSILSNLSSSFIKELSLTNKFVTVPRPRRPDHSTKRPVG